MTGLLSDWFPEEQRGLVMSIFNWGIYGGYGIAFPVGRYVPELNAWDLVSQYPIDIVFFVLFSLSFSFLHWFLVTKAGVFRQIIARYTSRDNFRAEGKHNEGHGELHLIVSIVPREYFRR